MSKIVDRLYLGGDRDAQSERFLLDVGVNIIVNCSKELPHYFEKSGAEYQYYRLPVEDKVCQDEMLNFYHYARELLPILYQHYMEGKTLFIHCFAGMQRSAALTLLFYIYLHKKSKHEKIRMNDAEFYLLMKRPLVFGYGSDMRFRIPVTALVEEIHQIE
jgi:hypothetical protein